MASVGAAPTGAVCLGCYHRWLRLSEGAEAWLLFEVSAECGSAWPGVKGVPELGFGPVMCLHLLQTEAGLPALWICC